jgi:DNA-binding NarL/FixJ family response regulator
MGAAMFDGHLYGPSEREQRVIALVAEGLKNSEVAQAIGTTEHVVKNYLRVIYDEIRAICSEKVVRSEPQEGWIG